MKPLCGLDSTSTVRAGMTSTSTLSSAASVGMVARAVVNVVHAQQVHMLFRARLLEGRFGPGDESLEVDLFTEDQVPWDEIAFGSVRFALEKYFEDRRDGQRRLHMTALKPMPR